MTSLHFFLCNIDKRRRRAVCLDATFSAAGALSAVHHHDRVTQLCSAEGTAREHLAVDYNASADTCSERYHNGGRSTLCGTADGFAERGYICIIADGYLFLRNTRKARKDFSHREIAEAYVVCIFHYACRAIDRTGNGNADTRYVGKRNTELNAEVLAMLRHIGGYFLGRALCQRRARAFYQNIIIFVNYTRCDICTAEVYAERIFHKKSPLKRRFFVLAVFIFDYTIKFVSCQAVLRIFCKGQRECSANCTLQKL